MAKDTFFDNKSILIIDKENKTSNDRTWCYWANTDDEWQDVVTTSWENIIFKSDAIHLEESIAPFQYKMIRSADFYSKIRSFLEKKQNITFVLEVVQSIHQEEEKAKVVTDKNEYITTTLLNSILFSNDYKQHTKYPLLQQHFIGYFIKVKDNSFDNSTATFMDFSIHQKGNTRFMYVLPINKKEALFEYTLFSKDLLPVSEYKSEIENYLKKLNISDYEITEVERGAIPMTCYPFWKQNTKNIINIGTAGGWTKASTGFTFKNTTRISSKLIEHLKAKKPLTNFHKKSRFWFYDLLLLDILAEKNHLGASIFSSMFQNIPPQKILQFLDEETTFWEELKLFYRMPKLLFSRFLFKRIF